MKSAVGSAVHQAAAFHQGYTRAQEKSLTQIVRDEDDGLLQSLLQGEKFFATGRA